MKPNLLAIAAIASALCTAPALAQDPVRGSTPPGTSQDGAAPAEGAIKGGAIRPGETGGVPDNRSMRRCEDLEGTLREQCLRDIAPSGGATRAPEPAPLPGPAGREPRAEPPPQNPR